MCHSLITCFFKVIVKTLLYKGNKRLGDMLLLEKNQFEGGKLLCFVSSHITQPCLVILITYCLILIILIAETLSAYRIDVIKIAFLFVYRSSMHILTALSALQRWRNSLPENHIWTSSPAGRRYAADSGAHWPSVYSTLYWVVSLISTNLLAVH